MSAIRLQRVDFRLDRDADEKAGAGAGFVPDVGMAPLREDSDEPEPTV
jgi:hypothetical protein